MRARPPERAPAALANQAKAGGTPRPGDRKGRFRRFGWSGGRGASDESLVRLTPRRAPIGSFEHWLVEELGGKAAIPRRVLVSRLAQRALQAEIRQGAAVLDIGLWGAGLFRREVEQALDQLDGDLISVGSDQSPDSAEDQPCPSALLSHRANSAGEVARSVDAAPESLSCR